MRQGASYRRLDLAEREEISRSLASWCGIREIARKLNRSPSTISREINRAWMNRYTYRAARSQRRAGRNAAKRRSGKLKLAANPKLWAYVCEKLLIRWSPGQIASRIRKDYPDNKLMRISAEAIYCYLQVMPRGELKKELLRALRQGRKKRRKKGQPASQVRREMEAMVGIDERPPEVATRRTPGHWEGDLLLGKNRQSALGSLVERKTRFLLLVPLKTRKAKEVRKAFGKAMKKCPAGLKRTLTYDQGREMAEHLKFTRQTKMQVYFAHPASPWERGTNENTNGLVRQYFPKGTDFSKVTASEIRKAQDQINGRPRRCLDYATPAEVFQQQVLR